MTTTNTYLIFRCLLFLNFSKQLNLSEGEKNLPVKLLCCTRRINYNPIRNLLWLPPKAGTILYSLLLLLLLLLLFFFFIFFIFLFFFNIKKNIVLILKEVKIVKFSTINWILCFGKNFISFHLLVKVISIYHTNMIKNNSSSIKCTYNWFHLYYWNFFFFVKFVCVLSEIAIICIQRNFVKYNNIFVLSYKFQNFDISISFYV